MRIIGLFPLTGNGGIASWTKKFRETFPDKEFQFKFINVSPNLNLSFDNSITRLIIGFYGLVKVLYHVRKSIVKEHFDILHTTTSGNIGHLRDYYVAKLCHRYGVKCIMHCRYGCIPDDIRNKGIVGCYLRNSMSEFDQIWVLDNKSYQAINSILNLKNKVYLTPNSIDVKETIDVKPKLYKSIAFCGNVYPTKGVLELVRGAIQTDVILHVIGPASEKMIKKIKEFSGEEFGRKVILHGRLANKDAVEYIKKVDMIALPTYYRSEAFPISIIEAMSLTKMVISCDRAAIPDMLTALDGSRCGLLVEPKSSDAIKNAIEWCQSHKEEADEMCMKAYQKVVSCYRKEIVYDLYRNQYRTLYNG